MQPVAFNFSAAQLDEKVTGFFLKLSLYQLLAFENVGGQLAVDNDWGENIYTDIITAV